MAAKRLLIIDDAVFQSEILKEVFENKEIDYKIIESIEGNILSKITNLIYTLDYSTLYLSILRSINPSPVNSIDFIKSKL